MDILSSWKPSEPLATWEPLAPWEPLTPWELEYIRYPTKYYRWGSVYNPTT
jgi:hypothetical protein